jgi:hypothetical protein
MFKWLSSSFREQRRKEKHELDLKRALAAKVARYDLKSKQDETNFTMIELDGRKMLVYKEQITIQDVGAYST